MKQADCEDVQQEAEGDADLKFQLLGLVAEELHPEKRSKASSQKGKGKKGDFGDAPPFLFCSVFIQPEQEKGKGVDPKHPNED